MAFGKHRDQELINNFVLTNDDFADFLPHSLIRGRQSSNGLFLKFGTTAFTGRSTLSRLSSYSPTDNAVNGDWN